MTIKDKPQVRKTDIVDSLDGISSVDQMYNTFVKPIDQNIRSFKNSPGVGIATQNERTERTSQEQFASQALSGGSIDVVGYNESRCHAFFRNVGFPVVVPDGSSFYNAGHDPEQNKTISTRLAVNNKIYKNPSNVLLIAKRENQFNDRKNIFVRQDSTSELYALLMRKPRPFLTAQTGKDPFFIDEQKTTIDSRKQEINDLGLGGVMTGSVPDIIINVPHILKPFVVDPSMEFAVEPEQSRRVAVPFLGSVDDLITGTDEGGNKTSVYRPIIEQIIMHRLQIKEKDPSFYEAINSVLESKTSNEAEPVLLALSGKTIIENIGEEVISQIQNFTTLQSQISNNLIKCIKVAVSELIAAVRILEELKAKTDYHPIPGQSGPEFPQNGKIRTASTTETRQKLALLELQELLSSYELSKTDDRVGSNGYVGGISVNLKKNLKPSMDNIKKQEDEQSRQVLNNIAKIEKITGEVSGLGIIDILAVYTALYTIDMRYLIGFLDQNSLSRLDYNFHELVIEEVQSQLYGGDRPKILDCLKEFERIFFNILAFADGLIISTSQTPTKARKGTVKGT
jgi:hypothetical protein